MDQIELNKIQKNLTATLEVYILSIIEKYGKYMTDCQLRMLKSIDRYNDIIKIFDFGAINGYADQKNIYMPLSAEKALYKMSKLPGFGLKKEHKSYTTKNLIINNNTYLNYIWHLFVLGSSVENYYEELLLHETLHFCGSGGATALKEGINELLARKLALDKNFKTSGCGYPKEVKIAYTLEKLLGEEVINQIAFINNHSKVIEYLKVTLGEDVADLYDEITFRMEEEFNNKYYKNMDSYDGLCGVVRKTINYFKIDYSEVYIIIDNYNIKKQNKKSI